MSNRTIGIAECLESRTLLSGNVTAAIDAGSLVIWGDDVANDIVVDQLDVLAGQVRVSSGGNATTINGLAGPVVLDGFTANLFAGMRMGPDQLTLRSITVPGNLTIQTGLGMDSVTVFDTLVTGDADIRTGIRADSIAIDDSTFQGDVLIDTRFGADSLRIEQSGALDGPRSIFNGTVDIRMGRGQDDLRMGLSENAGNLAVFYGQPTFYGGLDYDELRSSPDNWFDFEPVVISFEYNEISLIPV